MSSKRFRGKLCVYCSERPSVTGDHIFARELFLPIARAYLPQVPTCDACNNEKSKLEHYLTSILPFGAKHLDAHQNLVDLVPSRLAKNLRLSRELQAGRGTVWHLENKIFRPAMILPVEPEKICAMFAYVARALVWFHWGTYLTAEHVAEGLLLSKFGQSVFNDIFRMNAANRVQNTLGSATIVYSGTQAVDMPELTFWRFQVYGGIAFSGDPNTPEEVVTEIGAITGPRHFVNKFMGQADTN